MRSKAEMSCCPRKANGTPCKRVGIRNGRAAGDPLLSPGREGGSPFCYVSHVNVRLIRLSLGAASRRKGMLPRDVSSRCVSFVPAAVRQRCGWDPQCVDGRSRPSVVGLNTKSATIAFAILAALVMAAVLGASSKSTAVGTDGGTFPIQDLGTLGGDWSQATAVNDLGQVIGWSATNASGDPHAFLWSGGSMKDLGTLGGCCVPPRDINNQGQVVTMNVLWQNGATIDLGSLGGGSTDAAAINDQGQVLGESYNATHALHPFLWQQGVMTDLSIDPGLAGAADINSLGQIIGSAPDGRGGYCPVLWDHGTMTDLGTFEGRPVSAVAFNEDGQIIGSSTNASGYGRAVLWDNGTFVDLGTLPGNGTQAWATDINEAGQVVGESLPNDGFAHAVLWTIPVPAPRFPIRDLGGVGGYPFNQAVSINALGQVLGDSSDQSCHQSVFLWENGTVRDLGPFSTPCPSGSAINDRGQFVGLQIYVVNGEWIKHAFVSDRGVLTDLGVGIANDINEAGQVVGGASFPSGAYHAALWQNGTTTDLGTLEGGKGYSTANAINDAGQIVGQSEISPGAYHAFLWRNGSMTDLGSLDASSPGFSLADDINNAGQVVGTTSVPGLTMYAFLWENGTMTDIGTLGGGFSRALAINDAGQVVGLSTDVSGEDQAFLWENGTMVDLGELPGDYTSIASDINEGGQVVGISQRADGLSHAVLWTTPPIVHDVAVTQASTSAQSTDVGAVVTISAVVRNQGTRPESFDVTAYAGSIRVGVASVANLAAGASDTLSFSWDTSTVSPGSYLVRVEATAVPSERHLADNVHEAGTVAVAPTPRAQVSGAPLATDIGRPVLFRCDAADGTPPFTFSWDFGDGSGALGSIVSHAFASQGTNTATCTVTDGSNIMAQSAIAIQVSPVPTVSVTVDRSAASPGTTITFTAVAASGTGEYTYTWEFGDGSSHEGLTATHTYVDPGEYAAIVSVLDSVGGTATSAPISVKVSRIAVEITLSSSSAVVGDTIEFSAIVGGGSGGTYTISWDFGDGAHAA